MATKRSAKAQTCVRRTQFVQALVALSNRMQIHPLVRDAELTRRERLRPYERLEDAGKQLGNAESVEALLKLHLHKHKGRPLGAEFGPHIEKIRALIGEAQEASLDAELPGDLGLETQRRLLQMKVFTVRLEKALTALHLPLDSLADEMREHSEWCWRIGSGLFLGDGQTVEDVLRTDAGAVSLRTLIGLLLSHTPRLLDSLKKSAGMAEHWARLHQNKRLDADDEVRLSELCEANLRFWTILDAITGAVEREAWIDAGDGSINAPSARIMARVREIGGLMLPMKPEVMLTGHDAMEELIGALGLGESPPDLTAALAELHGIFMRLPLSPPVQASLVRDGADPDSEDFKPAGWFPVEMRGRLRQAATPKRRTKRVRIRKEGGVALYSVADARRWWPGDMPAAE